MLPASSLNEFIFVRGGGLRHDSTERDENCFKESEVCSSGLEGIFFWRSAEAEAIDQQKWLIHTHFLLPQYHKEIHRKSTGSVADSYLDGTSGGRTLSEHALMDQYKYSNDMPTVYECGFVLMLQKQFTSNNSGYKLWV